MVVECEIEFDDNQQGVFFAGQQLSGNVSLRSDKPKEVQGVLLNVTGYAVTKWTERSFARSKQFVGREYYLATLTYLLGAEQNNNKHTLQTGIHRYNFACQLPHHCPTSFEGTHGCIRYVVKVVLMRPWKFDQTYTRGFTLLKALDLNYEPPLALPKHSEAYRTFCCGPCKTEPLKMELHIPQMGYVPGQRIPVTVVVINNTSLAVSAINLSLVMLVRYFSQEPPHSRVEYITVTQRRGDSVLRNCTRSLNMDLVVPATPPTCKAHCKLINIAYHIEVEAKVNSARDSQIMQMPITIGTLPLLVDRGVSDVSDVVLQQPTSQKNELPLLASIAEGATRNYIAKDMPAKYVVANHTSSGNINEEELYAFGPNEFAPVYPVYSVPSPAAVTAANSRNCNNVTGNAVK